MEQENKTQKNLWFKAKMYGWGWTPISWQGWIVMVVYLGVVAHYAITVPPQPSVSDLLAHIASNLRPPTIVLIIICYWKGEKPRWHWGIEEESNGDNKN
jgi:hypothetical protein